MAAVKVPFMRLTIVLLCSSLVLTARGVTPEVGRDKLRQLVKLPTITFDAEWTFDPETGFTFGSGDADIAARIKTLSEEVQDQKDDAEGYLRLATLYSQVKDMEHARPAWARAVELYRKRADEQPDDASLLAGLGEALNQAGRPQEAESVLRQAVRLDPKDWKCRLALGRCLDDEARHDISDAAGAMEDDSPAASPRSGQPELAPDRVTLAYRHLDEAGSCFDLAVTNAPTEGDALVRRGFHRTLRSYLVNDIREASGEQKTETEILGDCFPPEALTDLQEASRLNPKDYHLIGNVVLFELYSLNSHTGRKGLDDGLDWNTLPDSAQRSVRAAVTQLEDLGQEPDPKVAAGALEVLGIVEGPVLRETDRRVRNLRRVLALDPSREEVWEMLAGTLARAGRTQELLSLCEDNLKANDSARGHMLLAKAYERLKRWDDAGEEVAAALNLSPNDLTANLSLAALLLKDGSDPENLDQVNGWLSRCDQLLAAAPPQARNRQFLIDFTLTRSIYLALSGDVDSAREWVQTVINNDPNNQLAKDIRAAMAY
jgi:tetratricopeptide (TPR) repeat protein